MLSREGTIERKSPKLLRETVKKSRQSLEESAFRCERTHVRLGQVDEICAPHAHTVQMGTCAQNNFRVFRQRFVQRFAMGTLSVVDSCTDRYTSCASKHTQGVVA